MARDADSQSEIREEKALWHKRSVCSTVLCTKMSTVDMDFSDPENEAESQQSLHLELEDTEVDSIGCSDVDSTTLTPPKKRSLTAFSRGRVLQPLSPSSDASSDSVLVRILN